MKSINPSKFIKVFFNGIPCASALCIAILLAYSSMTLAEEIRIPVGSQGGAATEVPVRGWTQTDVENAYGQPDRSTDNIGKPEISVWHYSEFSVYFEHNWVIHSVIRHEKAAQGQVASN